MPAIDFPNSPTVGQEFTSGEYTWQWTGSYWTMVVGSEVAAQGSAYIGEIKMFASAAAVPPLFLVCNGAAVSRATYATLFAKIGTTWGPGNGTTTFNLPNLIDRSVRGGSEGGAVGGSADSVVVTHNHGAGSGTESADHNHTTDINHLHEATSGDNNSGFGSRQAYVVGGSWGASADAGAPGGWWDYAPTYWVASAYNYRTSGGRSAAHTHAITVNNAGESGVGKNWPPYGTVVPAIYAGV